MTPANLDLERARVDLSFSIARAARRGLPKRKRPVALMRSSFRPWYAQTWLLRAVALFLVLVAGRQAGKTHVAAFLVLQHALARPRAFVAILCPTYLHAEAAISKLREFAEEIPGVTAESWKEQKKRLELPGGRVIRVFSADRKETVRGPSIALLWMDEAGLLSVEARDAALGALSAQPDARVLATSSPIGKNWLFDWWSMDRKKAPQLADATEAFRFRSKDSPYYNARIVEAARSAMTLEKAAQEYDAEFVDSLLIAFPDRSRLYVDEADLPARKDQNGLWYGIDLGKSQDWSVLTVMNGWGEARIKRRVQRFASWTTFYDEIAAELLAHPGAVAVIDTGGPGGAPGAVLADFLEGKGIAVVRVSTNVPGTKAKIVEQARLDVQYQGTVVVVRGEHTDQLEYEFSRFQGRKRVVKGQEIVEYEGPQGQKGEFDDCVVSFCLANWGRAHGEEAPQPRSNLRALLPPSARRGPSPGASGPRLIF